MVKATLLTSTIQNPQSIFSMMWNGQCGTTLMINYVSRFYHPLHLFVLLGHVQLHQLSFCKSIITFLGKLCQFHVHGVECQKIPFGNPRYFTSNICKLCPHTPLPKVGKFSLVKWWWITKGCNKIQCCMGNLWFNRCVIQWNYANNHQNLGRRIYWISLGIDVGLIGVWHDHSLYDYGLSTPSPNLLTWRLPSKLITNPSKT